MLVTSLRLALHEFAGVDLESRARPIPKYSPHELRRAVFAQYEVALRGGGKIRIPFETVVRLKGEKLLGLGLQFPPLFLVVDQPGRAGSVIGYFYSTGGLTACYDISGGQPILSGSNDNLIQPQVPLGNINFTTTQLPGVRVEAKGGRFQDDRFTAFADMQEPADSVQDKLGFSFIAKKGDRNRQIGYSAPTNVTLGRVQDGQDYYCLPVFSPEVFQAGRDVDLNNGRLLAVIEHEARATPG